MRAMRLAHKRKALNEASYDDAAAGCACNPGNSFRSTVRQPGHGTCTFTTNDKTKTVSLVADCTTDTTIGVENGWTLDGKGFTITAVDVAAGAAFNGAVVQNDGAAMNVKNLKIEGGEPNNCVAHLQRRRLHERGRLDQERHAQQHRADDRLSVRTRDRRLEHRRHDAESVAIENNTVSNYNKNGIDVRGNVNAKITGNTVTGSGPSRLIAQNGIVVLGAIRSRRSRATRSAGTTTPGRPARMPPGSSSSTARSASTGRTRCPATRSTSTTLATHHRRQVQRLTTRAAGVATPTPDSPARQLMHRKARSGGPSSFSWARLDEPPGLDSIS